MEKDTFVYIDATPIPSWNSGGATRSSTVCYLEQQYTVIFSLFDNYFFLDLQWHVCCGNYVITIHVPWSISSQILHIIIREQSTITVASLFSRLWSHKMESKVKWFLVDYQKDSKWNGNHHNIWYISIPNSCNICDWIVKCSFYLRFGETEHV